MKKLSLILAVTIMLTLCSCGAEKKVEIPDFEDEVIDMETGKNKKTSEETSDNAESPDSDNTASGNENNQSKATTSGETVINRHITETKTNNASSDETKVIINRNKNKAEENTSSDAQLDIPVYKDNRTVVACWGDSITEGMGMTSMGYPARLSEMLGDKYNVLNGGDGGETSATIAARQGGLKVYTSKRIYFDRGSKDTFVASEKQGAFVTADNLSVTLTSSLGNALRVNDVTINGEKFTLSFDNFTWEPRTFKLKMTRNGSLNKPLDIPKGSEVIFASTEVSKNKGIDIYLMGANGGYRNEADYVSQLKAMIKHHKNGKYIIVKPYWQNMTTLEKNFGEHVVDFKELARKDGLKYEKLTATDEDISAVASGKVPASLKYNNEVDNVHLNQNGYHFLAHCIYEKGKELGYF